MSKPQSSPTRSSSMAAVLSIHLLPCLNFIHSFIWEKALQLPSTFLKPVSFLESTPMLRTAKQPPSSTP